MQTVNERIATVRKYKSLTQKAFSELLEFPRTSYCEIENGNRCPNVELVSSVANTFKDISLDWLLTGEGTMLKGGGGIIGMNIKQKTLFEGYNALSDQQQDEVLAVISEKKRINDLEMAVKNMQGRM